MMVRSNGIPTPEGPDSVEVTYLNIGYSYKNIDKICAKHAANLAVLSPVNEKRDLKKRL